MKHWILATLGTTAAFAAMGPEKEASDKPQAIIVQHNPAEATQLGYAEIITGSVIHPDAKGLAAGMTVGRTFYHNHHGVDVSATFMRNDSQAYATFPKVLWVYYPNNHQAETLSPFWGGGASLACMSVESLSNNLNSDSAHTLGIFFDAMAGFHVNFHRTIKGVLKLSIAVPHTNPKNPVVIGSFGVAY